MRIPISNLVNIFFIGLFLFLGGCIASTPEKKISQVNPEEHRCKYLTSYISSSDSDAEKKRSLNLIAYVETGCLLIMSRVPKRKRVIGSGEMEHFPIYEVPKVLAQAEIIDRDRAIKVASRLAEYNYHTAQVYLASKVEDWDRDRAFELYQQAALGNQCSAQLRLGWAYYKGTLVQKNLHMSFFWLSRAAEPPRSVSMNRYGLVTPELRKTLKEEGFDSRGGPLQHDWNGFLDEKNRLGLISALARSGESLNIECPSSVSLQMFLTANFPARVESKVNPILAQYLTGQPIPAELIAMGSNQISLGGANSAMAKEELKFDKPISLVDLEDSEQEKVLEQRLAKPEAEKNAKQQSITKDTQRPTVRITGSRTEGARGRISGSVNDNSGIAEVLINGQVVSIDSFGRFNHSTFVPSGGLDIEITAYDLKGLSTTETVRLERTKRNQPVSRLAAVNPLVGPKQKTSLDRAALIIGLEKYARAPISDFAARDAQMFADYAREKLGVPDNNIKILIDIEAEEAAILRALKVWLPKAVKPDTTDLYIFYAGHGMPTADGTSAYLVPYDGDIQLLEDTAISRKRFFDEISATKPRSATFFFDNCYSGATRSEQQLLAARPLGIKVKETNVPDNYLVFAAGETDQIAGVEPEVKHGRFSYFVFKGLEGEADANQDGKISAGELHKYVRESVGRFSAGAQTPTMLGDAGRWVLR